MIEIQSRQNAALRHLARLGRERKYRRSTGEMLCEGGKMLYEAISSGAQVGTLLVRAGREDQLPPGLLEDVYKRQAPPRPAHRPEWPA